MALVAHFDLELHQMDFKTVFLIGDPSKKVYMLQPEGFKQMGKRTLYVDSKGQFMVLSKLLVSGP